MDRQVLLDMIAEDNLGLLNIEYIIEIEEEGHIDKFLEEEFMWACECKR